MSESGRATDLSSVLTELSSLKARVERYEGMVRERAKYVIKYMDMEPFVKTGYEDIEVIGDSVHVTCADIGCCGDDSRVLVVPKLWLLLSDGRLDTIKKDRVKSNKNSAHQIFVKFCRDKLACLKAQQEELEELLAEVEER